MDDIIRDSIRKLARPNAPAQAYLGTIIGVDWTARTCDIEPQEGGALLLDVLLSPNIGGALGIIGKPVIGADCVVMMLTPEVGLLISCAQYEQVSINGEDLGGIVKALELKQQLNKTNSLLNALITAINGTPVPEPGNGSPSALQTALKTAITGQALGDYSNIESNIFKHGTNS